MGSFFAGFICLVSKAAIKMAIRKNLKVISSDALSEGPIEARASSLPRDQSITQSNEKRCLCQRKSCCEKKTNKKSTPRYFLKEVNPGTPG